MSKKPEALRLADELDWSAKFKAAKELRRLHAENEWLKADNERLRETLQWIASRCPTDQFVDLQPHRIHLEAAHDAGACARAALKEVPR